jgi:5-methylcytosine-specific restriction protein B
LFEPTKDEKDRYEINVSNYLNNPLKLPSNLYVLCAMNTADRNISSIDVAIRRRFSFVNIWPSLPIGDSTCDLGRQYFNKMKDIYLEYGNKQDLNLMPGGFYFLGNDNDQVCNTLKNRLLPLLEDYLSENRLSKSLLNEIDLFIQQLKQVI